jgi:hypothetical protein
LTTTPAKPTTKSTAANRTRTDVSSMKLDQLRAHRAETRAQLASTFDALEDKVNVPKQLGKASRKFGRRVQTLRRENPVLLAGIAAGVVAAIGLTAYVVVKITSKR